MPPTFEFRTTRKTSSGNAKQTHESIEVYADLVDDMKQWRAEGMSLADIAGRLNELGHTTRTGCEWSKVQVMRLLRRTSQ